MPPQFIQLQFRHGQGCPLFGVVHPAFPLPTTASSILQGALMDGFGQAVEACDMPKPWKFPSFDSGQKSFLWTHKEVYHARIQSLVLFPKTGRVTSGTWFRSLDPFFRVSKQGPSFTAKEEDESDKRLVQLDLACEADGIAAPDPA